MPGTGGGSSLNGRQVSRLVRGDFGRRQALHTLQLDGRLAAVDADVGVAAMRGDVVMALQIAEGIALDIQLIAGDKVSDDVLTALRAGNELEQVVVAAAGHRVMA